MVKLVLLATVSLNGTKLTFSLVGLMLICLKKVHNKRLTLVNWSKKLVSNLTKLTLQYWNVLSKQLTWLLKLLTNCGFQLKNHGAWTNVTTVVWLVKQSWSCWTIWWWASSHLASFIRCIASKYGPWWWALSSHRPSLCFTWRLSHSRCWKLESDFGTCSSILGR